MPERLTALIFAHRVHQRLTQRLQSLQLVYPLPVLDQLARIPLHSLQRTRQAVDVLRHTAGRQLARLLNALCVQFPQGVIHMRLSLQGLLRRLAEDEWFARRLVLPHTDQVRLYTQLVQRLFVVVALATKTLYENRPHGMHGHLTGMRCQVVLALVIPRRPRQNRLTRSLELFNGASSFTQRSQTRALEIIELQQHPVNPFVFFRQCECHLQITQTHRICRLTLQLAQNLVAQPARRLFHQGAFEVQHQHRMVCDGDPVCKINEPDHAHTVSQDGQHQANAKTLGEPIGDLQSRSMQRLKKDAYR